MAAIAFVGVGALDGAAGQGLGLADHFFQGVSVPRVRPMAGPRTSSWIAGQRFAVKDELAALAAAVGGGDRGLDAELIGPVRLALADTLRLGGMPGIDLGATLLLALAADLGGLAEGHGKGRLQRHVAVDLACDVAE